MKLKTPILLLIVVAIGALAALNWATLSVPTVVSLGVATVQAPLGLIMLGLTVLLGAFFLAYVLTLQGSVLMETRRHAKEMAAQRELADRAEASRFTELRQFLETQHRTGYDALMPAGSHHFVETLAFRRNNPRPQLLCMAQKIPGPGVVTLRIGIDFKDAFRVMPELGKHRMETINEAGIGLIRHELSLSSLLHQRRSCAAWRPWSSWRIC